MRLSMILAAKDNRSNGQTNISVIHILNSYQFRWSDRTDLIEMERLSVIVIPIALATWGVGENATENEKNVRVQKALTPQQCAHLRLLQVSSCPRLGENVHFKPFRPICRRRAGRTGPRASAIAWMPRRVCCVCVCTSDCVCMFAEISDSQSLQYIQVQRLRPRRAADNGPETWTSIFELQVWTWHLLIQGLA